MALLLLAFSACATTTALMEPPLPEAGAPDLLAGSEEEIAPGHRLTVVLDVDAEGQALARSANLESLLRSALIGDLSKVGADDVDRDMERSLIEELRLIVAKGGRYTGSAVADYAVFARFIEAAFDVSYDKPIKIPFMDEAEYRKKPGSCDYEVSIHIGLKILDLSRSARTVKTINVKESEGGSLKTMRKNCQSVVPDSEKLALARSATKKAMGCFSVPLQAFLAPRGQVMAATQDEKGHTFFRISTGKSGGVKTGDLVEIYRRGSGEAEVLAQGRVHKKIGSKHAWVVVGDETQAVAVQRGDLAKVRYNDKLMQSRDWVKCRSVRTES